MKKEKKVLVIESLAAQLALTPNFYVVDLEGMNARRLPCCVVNVLHKILNWL